MDYAKTISLDLPYEDAVDRVKEAFKARGFGTLTEIDVQATLKAKLNADTERYIILGLCNPNLAKRALDVERNIGLLLPCNVVVREREGGVWVQALDPSMIATLPGIPALEPIAAEANTLVEAALEDLTGAVP